MSPAWRQSIIHMLAWCPLASCVMVLGWLLDWRWLYPWSLWPCQLPLELNPFWRVGYSSVTLWISTSFCYRSEWKPSHIYDHASFRTTFRGWYSTYVIHLSQKNKTPLLHLLLILTTTRIFSSLVMCFNFAAPCGHIFGDWRDLLLPKPRC